MGVSISGMKFEAPNVLILCMDNNEGTVRISRLLWDQRARLRPNLGTHAHCLPIVSAR